MFPSPYGDMVLKLRKPQRIRGGQPRFPSPYGDMVLKFLNKRILFIFLQSVSVPLRGYGFEIPCGEMPCCVWLDMPFCGADVFSLPFTATLRSKNRCMPHGSKCGGDFTLSIAQWADVRNPVA